MSATLLPKTTDRVTMSSSWRRAQPRVSVIVPCYNEERFIGNTLRNLVAQYPSDAFEIIVVDSLSDDATRDVVQDFQETHPHLSVTLILNPELNIPKSLNLGIAAATGEIIARMDAHASPSAGYIRRCVEVLGDGQAEIVGMPCHVKPGASSATARAIALAVSHRFGIGDARYRLTAGGDVQEAVDTVAFACFRKSTWSNLGGYDESLLTNEDYDFNYRARTQGGRVILDRSGHCDYFARETFSKLVAQYKRYGAWKARMIRNHPGSIRMRHVIAPLFVASIILLAGLGFWRAVGWALLAGELGLYFVAATTFAAHAALKGKAGLRVLLLMPFVFFAIHLSWGGNFLLGLVRQPR